MAEEVKKNIMKKLKEGLTEEQAAYLAGVVDGMSISNKDCTCKDCTCKDCTCEKGGADD